MCPYLSLLSYVAFCYVSVPFLLLGIWCAQKEVISFKAFGYLSLPTPRTKSWIALCLIAIVSTWICKLSRPGSWLFCFMYVLVQNFMMLHSTGFCISIVE